MKELSAAIVVVTGAVLVAMEGYQPRSNNAAQAVGTLLCIVGVMLLASFGLKDKRD
jgi:drug/metabolite transporter (DMT)-like permease